MDLSKVTDIVFDGVDHRDYPDYSDAYIVSATYEGQEMTEEQLEELNDDRDFVYETLLYQIF